MRSTRTTIDWREQRRLRAWALYQKGWSQVNIAEALGVCEGSVSIWLKRARQHGIEALRLRYPPGATPRLSPEQLAQLPQLLARGAQAYGFRGELWTRKRIATVIARTFNVQVSLPTVSRLMQRIGWTRQTPSRRATQRDEAAITQWQQQWPALKKKSGERATHDCVSR